MAFISLLAIGMFLCSNGDLKGAVHSSTETYGLNTKGIFRKKIIIDIIIKNTYKKYISEVCTNRRYGINKYKNK